MKRLSLTLLSAGALFMLFVRGGGASSSVTELNGVGSVEANTSIASLVAAAIIIITYLVAIEPEGKVT
jgi:hypothetical protein